MTSESNTNNSWAVRLWAALVALFWTGGFTLLIMHVPGSAKVMAAAWGLTALAVPRIYLLSLVLLLPFFGNNPGGPHHLYLLDMGMMLYVVRRCAERTARPGTVPGADGLQSLLVIAFTAFSTATLIPQIKRIHCEIVIQGSRFLYENYAHYGNSHVFGIHAWMSLALSAAFFGCLVRERAGVRERGALLWGLVAAGAGLSIIGLLEYMGAISLEWWRPENPYITRFGYRRLQSLFWHSAWLGQFLAAAAPCALAIALLGRGTRRIAAAVFFALMAVSELFTLQRGAWLGFAAGVAAVMGGYLLFVVPGEMRRKLLRRVLAGCALPVVLIGVAALLHAPLRERMMEMAKVSDRLGLWSAAWEMGMRWPSTGMGLGNYSSVYQWLFPEGHPYFLADDKTTAHSLPLHIFAERGAYTTICFIAMYGVTLWGVAGSIRKGAAVENGMEAGFTSPVESLAVLGGLTALAVDGIFQYTFYLRVTETVFWLLTAWAGRSFVLMPRWQGALTRPRTRVITALATAGLLIWLLRVVFVVGGTIHHDAHGWFHTEGLEAEITIPAEGTQFSIVVYSVDPLLEYEPLTLAFWHGSRLVTTHVFQKAEPAEIALFFPKDRDPEEKLRIIASRVWRPYVQTNRLVGRLEAGVCWNNFRALDGGGEGSK